MLISELFIRGKGVARASEGSAGDNRRRGPKEGEGQES